MPYTCDDAKVLMLNLKKYYKYALRCSESDVSDEEFEELIETARSADYVMFKLSEEFHISRFSC